MKKYGRFVLLLGLVLTASVSFASSAFAGTTFWLSDGSSSWWSQLYYSDEHGTYALPIYMNGNGDVFDLSDSVEVQYNPR